MAATPVAGAESIPCATFADSNSLTVLFPLHYSTGPHAADRAGRLFSEVGGARVADRPEPRPLSQREVFSTAAHAWRLPSTGFAQRRFIIHARPHDLGATNASSVLEATRIAGCTVPMASIIADDAMLRSPALVAGSMHRGALDHRPWARFGAVASSSTRPGFATGARATAADWGLVAPPPLTDPAVRQPPAEADGRREGCSNPDSVG